MDALLNSKISYPTWKEISKKLAVQYVDPYKEFGNKSLTKENDPIYSVINNNEVETPCGVDIPLLLKPNGESKGLIVILGESPLRSPKDLNDIKASCNAHKNVILGTPYALHLSKTPPKCGVYRKIFNVLLKEGYSLYITDIVKVWWKNKKLVPTEDLDIPIFKMELDTFKDRKTFIVAWGKKAENALMKIDKERNLKMLSLPHPSSQNRDSWKLNILEKAVFVKKDISYAMDFYKDQEAPTTDEIVAKVAIGEIISFVDNITSGVPL